MRQEGGQGREGFASVDVHDAGHCGRELLIQHRRVGVQPLAHRALRALPQRRAMLIQRQGHRVAAKALVGDKALGSVDEFFQILDAVGAFFFGTKVLHQPGGFEHLLDDAAQVQPLGLLTQHIDHGHKRAQVGARLAWHGAHRVVQRATGGAGGVLQHLDAARTNAARRKVDHATEAGVVVRVLQEAQIRQCVLDFRAFKKAQTAIHTVRHAGIEQGRFDYAALGIAAVKHGDFLALETIALYQLLDLIHHPLRLGQVGAGLVHAHRLARALRGAQVFAQAAAVVADEGVGRVEDVAVAAVVLLELDLALHIKFAHKVGHVAHARAAKRIDALVVIAHGNHAAARLKTPAHLVARQLLEPGVLQLVGVLKLIDQHVLKPALVVLADGVVVAQQFVRAQHQLAKVHHAFALALFFVQLVDLDLLARIAVMRGHIAGAHAFFLAVGNEVGQLLGRKTLVVHVVLLAQALDGRELVLRVEDLERLRQACRLVVRA